MVHPAESRGNILFLILIAVALFAALSFAITQSTRGTGTTSAGDKAALGAARLLAFGGDMQSRFDRMKIANGIKATDFYIETDAYKLMNNTVKYCCLSSVATPAIGLFHPQGAGVVPQVFEDIAATCAACDVNTTTKPGHLTMVWVNSPGISTRGAALAMWIVAITRDACNALNAKVGIGATAPPVVLFSPVSGYARGSAVPSIPAATGSAADLNWIRGKTDYCFQTNDGTSRYVYAHILQEN